MKSFKITNNDALKYSKISGDYNKIHTNDKIGYNSIFGEKICHGTLALIKILKLINLKRLIKDKKKFSINVKFQNFIKYNNKIFVLKKKNTFTAYQDLREVIKIKTNFENPSLKTTKLPRYKKISIFTRKKKYKKDQKIENISYLLNILSKYVGTVYPGDLSIIKEISINFNFKLNPKINNIKIISNKLDPRFPIIQNRLSTENFIIDFQSIERPVVKKNKKFIPKIITKKIKKIKYNALIVGGSQGIGLEVVNILNQNKKITKIVTYNVNKIKKSNKKMIPIKLNIFKDLNIINNIIKKHSPLRIFYFASPKISFENKLSRDLVKKYQYMFLKAPLTLLRKNKTKEISFFYPSTTNIFKNKNAYYSQVKRSAEIKLSKLCNKNDISINIIRFPALYSRQSVSIINPNPPSLTEFLQSNPNIFSKIF